MMKNLQPGSIAVWNLTGDLSMESMGLSTGADRDINKSETSLCQQTQHTCQCVHILHGSIPPS
jgi:hypothetical protein